MRVKFYGTRGSVPVCDADVQEFGGNTACILVIGPHHAGILDAGSGIRNLGKDMLASDDPMFRQPMYMLFSHFHWDHIQGFPFFGPGYDPTREFIVTAPGKGRMTQDLRAIFEGQMAETYFPVPLDTMSAKFTFHTPGEDEMHAGAAKLIANRHSHPGGAYGYRLESVDDRVLVYCSDVEHENDVIDPSVVELARGADVLIHEAQYTTEELQSKRGWGHSSYEQALAVAEQAEVKRLVITHHDPDHDDAFLRDMERVCQDRFPETVLARDRMELTL
jgi:phosphoribosyl 1,2-cyclic phosphodiesterase